MSFRFWKRKKIAPGVTLNLSRSGASVSLGPRGAKLTVGSRGVTATAGIPGSGLFYSKKVATGGRRSSASKQDAVPGQELAGGAIDSLHHDARGDFAISPGAELEIGFFQRFTVPEGEKAFVEGCRSWLTGDEGTALAEFERARSIPDAALVAGLLRLKEGHFDRARQLLQGALEGRSRLGQTFAKYKVSAHLALRLSEELWVMLPPGERVATLALIEAEQHSGELGTALERARELFRRAPTDALSAASYAELLLESSPGSPDSEADLRALLRDTAWAENETIEGTAVLLFRGVAAHRLGLHKAAREALTAGLRRKKDRPVELLAALHAARRDVYRDLGDRVGQARDQEWLEAHGYSGELPS